MRGKDYSLAVFGACIGITPACAGKRGHGRQSGRSAGDHPRVCGEKAGLAPVTARARGSPPRVRGKGNDRKPGRRAAGITPACAGKSKLPLLDYSPAWDHPRVCGEKVVLSIFLVPLMGSPPRVRGKERQQPRKHRVTRITPACAGKSLTIPKLTTRSWDHPRVCGEKAYSTIWGCQQKGSPPRVRGKVCRIYKNAA